MSAPASAPPSTVRQPVARTARRRLVAGVATMAVTASLVLVPAALGPSGNAPAVAADPNSRVLSATATNPSGGDVTTTFLAARVEAAENGWQGTAASLPSSPDARPGATDVAGPMRRDGSLATTPSTGDIPYQRFDLPWRGDGQTVQWNGTVDSAREIVLSAWNGSSWEVLTRARGLVDGDLTLEAPVAARHEHDGVVPVLVHALDPFADDIDHDVKDGLENPATYDFAIAHHSDTQYVVRGSLSKSTAAERAIWKKGYTDATQWIADNAKERKIVLAAHTGDLVDNWLNDNDAADPGLARREFAVASEAQKIVEDAGVITTTLPGNHDNLRGTDNGTGAMFNELFGPSRYEALAQTPSWQAQGATYAPWRPGDAANSVTTFSAGGLDFVAVSLGFGVTDEEAAWADSVFKQYSDRNGILLTHGYSSPSASPDGRGGGFSADGSLLRQKVVAPNPNIAIVLSGHESGVAIGVRKNIGRTGNHVVELLADYQHYTFGARELGIDLLGGYQPNSGHRLGASFLRLLQVDVARSEMSVDTFSPYRNRYGATGNDVRNRYDGREDDFRIPVQLTSRATSFSTDALLSLAPGDTVIDEVTVGSGERAETTWAGLTPGRTYGWRAVSTDAVTGEPLEGASPSAWFIARRDSDSTAPRLTVPAVTSIGNGAAFDPMQGVTARDEDGTVLTSKVVVTGRIENTRPGRQSLFYAVSDEAGNTAVAQRTIVVGKAPAPVNTKIPSIKGAGTVGTVLKGDRGEWRNLDDADVLVQWLRNGKAIPGATGSDFQVRTQDVGALLRVQIEVRAAGRTAVSVMSEATRVKKLTPERTVTVAKTFTTKKKAKVKVRYTSQWAKVGGTVEVRLGKKKLASAKLKSDGRATMVLPKLKKGTRTLKVVYLGNGTFKSWTTTKKVKVTKPKAVKKKKAVKVKKKTTKKARAKKAAKKS